MLAIAALGLLVNLAAFAILRRGDRENLNMQGAVLHVLGDLLGSVAAIVAALVIVWTGWAPIDPLLSLLVAVLILHSAWRLLRKSAHILLEGAPDWLDDAELRAAVTTALPAIQDVHHVHAWMLTTRAAADHAARRGGARRRPPGGAGRRSARAARTLRHRPRHDPDRDRRLHGPLSLAERSRVRGAVDHRPYKQAACARAVALNLRLTLKGCM